MYPHPIRRSRLHDVYLAMCAIADDRGLAGEPTTHQGKLAVVEGIAHELAHTLEAGRKFEQRLHRASDSEANRHEASALRIEVAALARLGVRVSLPRLWRDANWRQGAVPARTAARRARSQREQACVRAFLRIVRRAIRREAPRLPGKPGTRPRVGG